MKKCIKLLNGLNIIKEPIVIACSGGPDSMALLYILKQNNYTVICAHVNHNVRIESNEEYKFLEQYCNKNNIIFEGMKIKKYSNNKFTENEARKIRYNFFETIINKYNSKYLLTAHHGDDLIETILMKINRGSSLIGYKGFSMISEYNDFKIIRPLIYYTKKEIQDFVDKKNIPYRIDKSNNSKNYTRNRFRLDVLPILKKENPNIHKRFLEFSNKLNDVNDYINRETNKILKQVYNNNALNIIEFNKQDKFMQKKILEKILLDMYKDNINLINSNNIREIYKLLDTNNKTIDFPKQIKIKKEYNKLLFNYKEDVINYNYILKDKIELPTGIIAFIDDINEKSNYVIKLNSKEIELPIHIRNKEDGDKINVKHMVGTKKINDIFIDNKIKMIERNSWPIVTDNNNIILWIPGLKKSKYDCSNEKKYDIIIKYNKKGEKDEKK